MPGLYKKRKRPTLEGGGGASSTNNDNSSDMSVWHSTAINTNTNTSGDEGGGGSSGSSEEGAVSSIRRGQRQPLQEEEDEELLSISPVKRPALGRGVLIPTPNPGGRRNDNTTDPASTANSSSPPGPSSLTLIATPSAAVHMDLREDEDEDEDNRDLFQDMAMEEGDKSPPQRPPPRPPVPKVVPVAAPPSSFARPLGPPVAGGSSVAPLDRSVHLSQRYGAVTIHPPSGHSFFSSTIHLAGFVLTLPKNHLIKDVLTFRNKMEGWMEDNTNERSRIGDGATKFLKNMRKYFGVKDNLIHPAQPPSMIKNVFNPVCWLVCWVFQGCKSPFFKSSFQLCAKPPLHPQDLDFVSTIVNQMKWFPLLVDGAKFADDLLEILEAATVSAKKHIIRLLPEIFMPEWHSHLVPELVKLFDDGTPVVNVAMLDCFSCLVVQEQESIRIRSSAVEQMTTARLEDLPAYISFIFRVGCPPQRLEEGIREMREKLEIKPRHKTPQEDAQMVEILERIRFFVSVNPAIVNIWLRNVKDDLEMEIELQTIDLLMLLIFSETSNKGALSMLAAVFSRPNLTSKLFDKMMTNNNPMLHELFPSIARFLDSVLRQKASKCHEAAAEVTKNLFVGLGPVLSQHLTSNLLGVLINGHPICRDAVLKIFTSIAETGPAKLLYFHSYLMGSLVYVIKYPPRQMQALMNILAILAQMQENINGEENSFTAEFMILLRKQITHANIRTRCFGVLGTIAAVRQLALNSNETNEGKIDGLLALAWTSIENDEEACSIFFDEMITCVKILPKDVSTQFRDILKMQFERLWTLDQSSDSALLTSGRGPSSELNIIPTFDGNKELTEDEGRLIIVLEPHALQMSPLVVPSLLRVMAELEKASEDGHLEGIDSLIGCPVLFPKFSTYYEKPDLEGFSYNQRFHLGQYLVLTLNYFRECVSAFVDSENPELRVKVWMRLGNIVTLQKCLVKHWDSFPNLPFAYGTDKNMKDGPGSSSAPGFSGALFATGQGRGGKPAKKAAKPKKGPNKKKGPKKAGQKKKPKREEEEDRSGDEEDQEVSEGEEEADSAANKTRLHLNKTTTDLEERIQPKFISSTVRRLDPVVFSLLIHHPLDPSQDNPVNYSEILRNLARSTQDSATMRRIEQFSPETFTLLLSEMKRQANDANSGFKLLSVDNLLSSLASHIDTIEEFYKDNSQLDDDGDTFYPLHSPALDSALRLLLKVLNLYFATLGKSEKGKPKEKLVSGLVSQIYSRTAAGKNGNAFASGDERDAPAVQKEMEKEMLPHVAQYLCNYATFVGEEDWETALEHVKLLKTFHDLLSEPKPMKKVMEKTIKDYLQRDWKLPASAITSFLKTWFSVTPSQMKVVAQLADSLLERESDEGPAEGPIPSNSLYKPANKTNFPTWYSIYG